MVMMREFLKEDKEKVFDFMKEINEYDGNFEGADDIGRIVDYDVFLNNLEIWKHQEMINPDYSPQTTFGMFDDEKLIGVVVLRHILKGALIHHSGNIGYLVRPVERNKGYGKKLLKLSLVKAKELGLEQVLVTCKKDNIGSMKVIESNGGIYENDYCDEASGKTFKRYWVKCV